MSPANTASKQNEDLIAKLDRTYPESWKPTEAGETLIGAFLRLENATTGFGPANVVVLGTDEGERSVWLFFEALKSGFRREKPEPGELVAIRYNGEVAVKNATPGKRSSYHDYSVAVDRPDTAGKPVDWTTALGAEPGFSEASASSPPGDVTAPDSDDLPF